MIMKFGIPYEFGDFNGALKLYESVLETHVRCLGTCHVSVTATKRNIGNVHWKRGDQGKAKHFYREAHSIYLKSLGADQPNAKALAPYI